MLKLKNYFNNFRGNSLQYNSYVIVYILNK